MSTRCNNPQSLQSSGQTFLLLLLKVQLSAFWTIAKKFSEEIQYVSCIFLELFCNTPFLRFFGPSVKVLLNMQTVALKLSLKLVLYPQETDSHFLLYLEYCLEMIPPLS